MGNIGPLELVALGLLAVLIFGPSKLPEMGRTIGKSLREFRETVEGVSDVKEVVGAVGEVRSAVSPTNLAGAFIPGVRDVQETVSAAKGAVSPDAGEAAAAKPAAPEPEPEPE
jgi:TatA/E family protein of Tat protein translocase